MTERRKKLRGYDKKMKSRTYQVKKKFPTQKCRLVEWSKRHDIGARECPLNEGEVGQIYF